MAIDSTPSIRPGGFQPEVASILSDGSDMPQKLEMAFHSKPCHNTNSRVAQWLTRCFMEGPGRRASIEQGTEAVVRGHASNGSLVSRGAPFEQPTSCPAVAEQLPNTCRQVAPGAEIRPTQVGEHVRVVAHIFIA